MDPLRHRVAFKNVMNQNKYPKKIISNIDRLTMERKKILSMTPDKVVDQILNAPQPAALVHSFPEEDLYFLIHDVGTKDSLPLISLASNRQWQYIMDMEVWDRDRINLESTGKWLNLLDQADSKRSLKWLIEQNLELVELYLYKNIEVIIREHDQDPSEFSRDYFTFDDYYYIRLINDPLIPGEDDDTSHKNAGKDHNEQIVRFLKNLTSYNPLEYHKFLLEAASVIPAETEEEMYRLRNVRLAEKGFLPFDEAIGIYQPLKPETLEKSGPVPKQTGTDSAGYHHTPFHAADLINDDNLFQIVLSTGLNTPEILPMLQNEFASLCNTIIVADQKKIQSKTELKGIVEKACGYISIGLKQLTKDKSISSKTAGTIYADLIKKHTLSNIFRVGYGFGLKHKWRAEKWLSESWFIKNGLPLTFWGEEWMGVLGGLLIKKPLFFDNYKTGVIYREFSSLVDLNSTEFILNEIIAFDRLLSLTNIKLETLSTYRFLTYKNLMLTLWLRHFMGFEPIAKPVSFSDFKNFYTKLWTGKKKPFTIRPSMKQSFLDWFSELTGRRDYEITEKAGLTLENLFEELEEEYGEVTIKNIDPRYIQIFLIEKSC